MSGMCKHAGDLSTARSLVESRDSFTSSVLSDNGEHAGLLPAASVFSIAVWSAHWELPCCPWMVSREMPPGKI